MNLRKFWGKNIKLIDIDNKEWTGFVEGYEDELNSPEKKESIDLRIDTQVYLFFDNEIKSIEILN